METKKIYQRLEYLDSVRGIAALMVVVYHFIGWQWADYTKYHVASLVFNGSDAVSFFFVLSGFVLSFRYLHTYAELDFPYYFYKRVLRLYPAFIVAVLINYFYWNTAWIAEGQFENLFVDMFWKNDQGLWEELLMIRTQHKFYIPGWTMGVEMALSMVMPLFIYAARGNIKMIWWFLPISIFLGPYMSIFGFHFALGVLLAYYYPIIKDFDWKMSKYYKYRYAIITLTFLLFSARHLSRIIPFGNTYYKLAAITKIDFFHYSGFASAVILLWIINNKVAQSVLINPILLFLGKISYSVYLMHWLIVVYVMKNWESLISLFPNWYLGFGVLLLATILATILSATVVYHFVEKPFIKIGKTYRLFEKRG